MKKLASTTTFIFGGLLLLLFLIIASSVVTYAQGYEQKHGEMLYTVVLVRGQRGSGSGTVIYSGEMEDEYHSYILTNHHVIADSISVEKVWDPKVGKEVDREKRLELDVTWHEYNDYSHMIGSRAQRADIVAYDKNLDLGLLRLKDRERAVSPVADMLPENEDVHLFDEVYAIGAGLGEPPFATRGELSFLDKLIDGETYLLSSAPIIFGNSGGALFRWSSQRRHYELIGVPSKVSVAGFTAVSHMAWAIPVSTVRRFLRESCYHQLLKEDLSETDCQSIGEVKRDDD